jgi:hypothetical protein
MGESSPVKEEVYSFLQPSHLILLSIFIEHLVINHLRVRKHMEVKTKKDIGRRTFIKRTVEDAGALAVAGNGASGAKEASTQSASSVQQKKYSRETPLAPIPDSQIKENVAATARGGRPPAGEAPGATGPLCNFLKKGK